MKEHTEKTGRSFGFMITSRFRRQKEGNCFVEIQSNREVIVRPESVLSFLQPSVYWLVLVAGCDLVFLSLSGIIGIRTRRAEG
jgi:hypothetical protein